VIKFRAGYKYQLVEDYGIFIEIFPPEVLQSGFLMLEPSGFLHIRAGYAWDGPSGPTFDTLDFMRGSLVHDALYQLMRLGLLDGKKHRKYADLLLEKICMEDGMPKHRARYVYTAVRLWGLPSATEPEKPILYAPTICN
jgi:hypothetical protein